MCALTPSGVIFVLTLGGIFLGALLCRVLPEDHLDEHVKGIVRLGVGLIAMIAALVLGLLIEAGQVRQITAVLILLDHILAQYGPEARPLREQIRGTVGPFATGSGAKRRPVRGVALRSTAPRDRFIWTFRTRHGTTV